MIWRFYYDLSLSNRWIGNCSGIICHSHYTSGLTYYAVQSRSQEKEEAFVKRLQILKVYSSYQELLEDLTIDIIYLATPHAFHYQMVKEVLQHQKHFF